MKIEGDKPSFNEAAAIRAVIYKVVSMLTNIPETRQPEGMCKPLPGVLLPKPLPERGPRTVYITDAPRVKPLRSQVGGPIYESLQTRRMGN